MSLYPYRSCRSIRASQLGPDSSMYFSRYAGFLVDAMPELKTAYPSCGAIQGSLPDILEIDYRRGLFLGDEVAVLFNIDVADQVCSVIATLVGQVGNEVCAVLRAEFAKQLIQAVYPFKPPVEASVSKDYKVVFSMLDYERQISLIKILDCVGEVRELYGLQVLPGFVNKALGGQLLLKTHSLTLRIAEPFRFGEMFRVCVSCLEVANASFTIIGEFIDLSSNQVKIWCKQKIACTNLSGRMVTLPGDWKRAMTQTSD